MQDAGARVSFVVKSMVQEWDDSVENLMYHFRYVLRAFRPFQKAKEDMYSVKKQGNLDHHAASYVSTAVNLLDERGMEIFFLLHGNYNINVEFIHNRLPNRGIKNMG